LTHNIDKIFPCHSINFCHQGMWNFKLCGTMEMVTAF